MHSVSNVRNLLADYSLFKVWKRTIDKKGQTDRQDFADGYALYAFDLSPDLADNEVSISPDTDYSR